MRSGKGCVDQFTHIRMALGDLQLVGIFIDLFDAVDVSDIQHRVHALRVHVQGQIDDIHIAGPLATMILADHGAEVIRVDPPGGPLWGSDANAVLQRGKRRISLDLRSEQDRAVAQQLIDRADVVVDGFRPPTRRRLGLERPAHTVWCSLPGFASDDPRAVLPAWEGILGAATGHYQPSPYEVATGIRSDPCFSALPLASTYGALVAVNSILAALIARERTGLGDRVEVPLFSAMFEAMGSQYQKLPREQMQVFNPCSDIDALCSDGRWIHVVMVPPWHFEQFKRSFLPDLGEPDEEARQRILDLFASAPSHEWDRRLNSVGVPCAVVATTEQWLRDDANASAIDAVVDVVDPELGPTRQGGFGASLDRTPAVAMPRRPVDTDRDEILGELRRPAPEPPSPTGEVLTRPLEGITAVDLALVLAGPSAGRILAEFGADVVKINRPDYWLIGHAHTNSGKQTTLIDVSDPRGKEVLWSLVADTDIFIQNLGGDAAARIGVDEAEVRSRRPDIVYSSVSAYNRSGPRAEFKGWEPIGQAATGMMLRWGGGTPRFARYTVCDYGTGHLSATAILLGLVHRSRTGVGQHVQTSLVQGGTHHQMPFMIAYEGKEWNEPSGPDALGWGDDHRLFRASDGWLFAVGVDLPSEAEFAGRPVAYWVEMLDCAHELIEPDALMDDPFVVDHGLSIWRDHPGIGPIRLVGPAPVFERLTVEVTDPAPAPGWDTRSVLGNRFDELAEAGVVSSSLPDRLVHL